MTVVNDFSFSRGDAMPGADNPVLMQLESYWRALRHARHIPARNDIRPHEIDSALPHAFILQRVAPGVARMRVAGQQLHDLLKMDARGMPVSSFFHADARAQIADLVELAFSEPAIVAVPLVSQGNVVRAPLTGTMLLLPLRDDNGQTSRVLGALMTQGHRGNRQRRFEIDRSMGIRVDRLGIKLAATQSLPRRVNEKGPDAQRPALQLVVNNA
ncbi:PAS domain-containing protein [Yoonia tamlensis]|uniref:PAS domain-containing protein n=1 Tax=Yoonia tamlensis TaxID=390270 RepID=A0A1I6GC95_9RHOB|nr:PAS domain-containing protein [Yoonia tamlensis]SFR39834.1 PAS domain-containing protein [Yoonia tamlensis]